ncbi:MAG: bile acid:sodium symporter [Bythopirellula sp.]|nr:bile acid:sodium symporter [Bythopirellula sp.]
MRPVLQRHWFLVVLGIALVVGMAFPEQSAPAAFAIPKDWIIAAVLLAMALPLEFGSMWNSLRRPGPSLLAVFISFVVVPLLAWPISVLFQPDLAAGIIIAAAVPCSMASVTVWTRMAGGNEAVSMLVTVITNLACFIVTPAWVWFLVGRETATEPFAIMAINLFLVVVLPIVAGQLLRLIPAVATRAKRFKKLLSIIAQLGVLAIVFMGAVFGGVQLRELDGQLVDVAFQILMMMVCVAALHLVVWIIGYVAARQIGMNREDQIAVAFGGSQKTLMVGLAIALSIGGLAILPMLAYHVQQLLIDTVLAGRLRLNAVSVPAAPVPD